jgi:hypothetical protein
VSDVDKQPAAVSLSSLTAGGAESYHGLMEPMRRDWVTVISYDNIKGSPAAGTALQT